MTRAERPVRRVAQRRATLLTAAAVLAATDLIIKAWADHALADGHPINLGVLQLRLAYNPGMAFSLGGTLPTWFVLTLTAAITAAIAVYAWREAPIATRMVRLGLTVLLGGAVANLVDRGVNGVVTDYLHTGWWPTFNLADVYIISGVVLLVLASLRPHNPTSDRDRPDAD